MLFLLAIFFARRQRSFSWWSIFVAPQVRCLLDQKVNELQRHHGNKSVALKPPERTAVFFQPNFELRHLWTKLMMMWRKIVPMPKKWEERPSKHLSNELSRALNPKICICYKAGFSKLTWFSTTVIKLTNWWSTKKNN